jgi:hypothetical protein
MLMNIKFSDDEQKGIVGREVKGFRYFGSYRDEGGWHDPFSGKDARAFWLTYTSFEKLLGHTGFNKIHLWEKRDERNGPRVALVASIYNFSHGF